jgi:hypothetical protein
MGNAVDRFIAHLRADPRFADCADGIASAMAALDLEASRCGKTSADAAGLYETLYWVVGRPDRLVVEKLAKAHELINRRGRQSGKIREIVGWR